MMVMMTIVNVWSAPNIRINFEFYQAQCRLTHASWGLHNIQHWSLITLSLASATHTNDTGGNTLNAVIHILHTAIQYRSLITYLLVWKSSMLCTCLPSQGIPTVQITDHSPATFCCTGTSSMLSHTQGLHAVIILLGSFIRTILPSVRELKAYLLARFCRTGGDKLNAVVHMLHGAFIQMLQWAAAHMTPVVVLASIAGRLKTLETVEQFTVNTLRQTTVIYLLIYLLKAYTVIAQSIALGHFRAFYKINQVDKLIRLDNFLVPMQCTG